MISQFLRNNKYFHLKLIHQHPNGIQNRFKNNADKWVQSLNNPQVKTYHQFFENSQTHQYQLNIPIQQKQQNHVKNIEHSHKPGLAQLSDFFKFIQQKRPDDYQLTQDISDMTFKKFIQEGRKNLNITHKLCLYTIGGIIVHIILYFIFLHDNQIPRVQRVKVLNAQILQNFQFQCQQTAIQNIIQRIKIVNDQYQKQLTLSKQK